MHAIDCRKCARPMSDDDLHTETGEDIKARAAEDLEFDPIE